jgi:hypothetical protein
MTISGAVMPSALFMQVAEINNADFAYEVQGLMWLPRNSSMSTYIHPTRCTDGSDGQIIKTSKTVYKKCHNNNGGMSVFLTFQLPPNLCENTCTSNSKCEGYTTDTAGQNCWLLNSITGPTVSEDVYWRVGLV